MIRVVQQWLLSNVIAMMVWNDIMMGCLLRTQEGFRGGRAKSLRRDTGMESRTPSLILIKELCMQW